MGAKRKRDSAVQVRPEAQQIFKGLSFFFVPNDDIGASRRMRIRKAAEFGAKWAREWSDTVTHVVVDKDVPYKDVIRYLKPFEIPSRVLIVNETYPTECLQFRTLFSPELTHYRVMGFDETSMEEHSASAKDEDSSVNASLQLKPVKMGVLPQPETPPQNAEDPESLKSPYQESMLPAKNVPVVSQAKPPSLQPDRANDTLSQAIEEERKFQHLPLEEDVEPTASQLDTEASSSDDEPPQPKKPRLQSQRSSSWIEENQKSYICMNPASPKDPTANGHTISILDKMAEYYELHCDLWRPRAYRMAVRTLRTQSKAITSASVALSLPHIGQSIARKIAEIATTQSLRLLSNTALAASPTNLFLSIHGVGPILASKWAEQGHRSLRDLLDSVPLTPTQRLCITRHADFTTRIPRAEVRELATFVRTAVKDIDPVLDIITTGSYRRGALTCGDVDLILTHPTHPVPTLRTLLLDSLLPALTASSFLKASLASPTRGPSSTGGTSFHGAVALPGTDLWRRLDILVVPAAQLGAALVYFTGDDVFNRSLRLLARRKGMRLNEKGLWYDDIGRPVGKGRGKGRVKWGEKVEGVGASEKGVFEALGVPWREPGERCC
ncbi:MAG: hypothetical protein M1833_005388 [Piccolia ochrophora]|nr:MAG: hypothetical protein M1833_005388 [Piccolia ochrophora]